MQIGARIEELESQAAALTASAVDRDPKDALIIACTPQICMSRFLPNGAEGDKPALDADHIFIDEAGYCGVLLSTALLANGIPVTFLGDHKQLPPVCTLEKESMEGWAGKDPKMAWSFLWDMSALYTEDVLARDPQELADMYRAGAEPSFARTVKRDLTASHRFGDNLAGVLDRFVYRNGIRGLAEHPLEIICIDVRCGPRKERMNRPEAEAISEWIRREEPPAGSFCILTPYKNQYRVLRDTMPWSEGDALLTVHKSQGREWDTVILSVQDGEDCVRDVPLRFTSSSTATGMKVINTAVSRAKKRLVIVCDRGFWLPKEEELIGALVSDRVCQHVISYSDGRLSD
ncbi:AAA domain-containing protein [Methanomassiliicoccales archaeon LGM-DZ1]|nr:AAA domain-containing protein [Methanomassiliicoccales archaeon LGM-DZ1]